MTEEGVTEEEVRALIDRLRAPLEGASAEVQIRVFVVLLTILLNNAKTIGEARYWIEHMKWRIERRPGGLHEKKV